MQFSLHHQWLTEITLAIFVIFELAFVLYENFAFTQLLHPKGWRRRRI